MLKFFKSKNPLIVIFYPIIAFAFLYFNSESLNFKNLTIDNPFIYSQILNLIQGVYFKLYYIILSVVFLSVVSFFFNQLIRNLKLVNSFQHLHGFIFLILAGFSLPFYDVLQVSVSLFFFLITINFIIKSLRKNLAVFDFFNAGFSLSVASFFWFQIIYFYPVIIIGLLVFRNLNFREILTSIIGLFIPYFFFFSIYFFINSDFNIIYDTYQIIFNKNIHFQYDLNRIIPGIILIIILLISTFHILRKYRSTESDIQDYYVFYFLLFLLALTYLIFLHKNDLSFILILMMTSAVPLGVYFAENNRPLIREIIFDLLILAVIFSQIGFLR